MTGFFDSAFLARLEQLSLLSRRSFGGQQRAERRSRRRGSSLEFADYRDYAPGDDLRRLDWNIYGRLDRFYVKLFEEEEELPIHILIDDSASMRWQPSDDRGRIITTRPAKFDLARRLAAALAYIGLAHLDHVHLHWLSTDGRAGRALDLGRGKAQFHRALEFLTRADEFNGPEPVDLTRALRRFGGFVKRRGLVLLVSDLLEPTGEYSEGIEFLLYNGFDVQLLHVLDPAELRPALLGDLQLAEVEGRGKIDVTADESLLREYERAFAAFLASVERFARQRQVAYVRGLTDVAFEDFALRALRLAGMLK
ncbi:hypothetical protein AYO41_01010 [Verrucomicrobia bacterium SCGC AG-212-E04]|nr:hypothetical protein AYO41_01010 [Verrucomicrobia bacterium SCGC AG-212-E04]